MDNRVSFAALLVTQGSHKFYVVAVPSKTLGETSFVITRRDDPEEGFQRRLDRRRIEEIAEYIDKGLGSVPTAIVVSAQEEANLVYSSKKKTLSFDITPQAFLIIDGQHRVGGFKESISEIRVPVVIYEGLTRVEEAQLFIDINDSQQPVPKDLLLDVKHLLQTETDEEQQCTKLFLLFNTRADSVLNGRLGVADADRGLLSRVHFNQSVSPVLRESLSALSSQEAFQTMNDYLTAVRDVLERIGIDPPSTITRPIVFRALMAVLPKVIDKVVFKDSAITLDGYRDALSPLKDNLQARSLTHPPRSYKALAEKLLEGMSRGRHVRPNLVAG